MGDAKAAWDAAAIHIDRRHIRVGRLVTYALVIGGPDSLREAVGDDAVGADADRLMEIAATIKASLTGAERRLLATLACAATTDAELLAVLASYPDVQIAMEDPRAADQAANWAAVAEADAIDAYALACFRQMTPERQAEFIDYITKYKDG